MEKESRSGSMPMPVRGLWSEELALWLPGLVYGLGKASPGRSAAPDTRIAPLDDDNWRKVSPGRTDPLVNRF